MSQYVTNSNQKVSPETNKWVVLKDSLKFLWQVGLAKCGCNAFAIAPHHSWRLFCLLLQSSLAQSDCDRLLRASISRLGLGIVCASEILFHQARNGLRVDPALAHLSRHEQVRTCLHLSMQPVAFNFSCCCTARMTVPASLMATGE